MNAKLSRFRPDKWYEWLLLATVAIVLIALLYPGEKWASSGTIDVTIHVVVFDIETNQPIENASVALVRSPPGSSDKASERANGLIAETWNKLKSGDIGMRTDSSGSVLLNQQFRTGASHENPLTRADTRWYWVLVSAKNYGGTAVPLRYDSVTTGSLREQAAIPAHAGLARTRSEPD